MQGRCRLTSWVVRGKPVSRPCTLRSHSFTTLHFAITLFRGTTLCDHKFSQPGTLKSQSFTALHFAITQFHSPALCDHTVSQPCTLRSHNFTALHFAITQFQIHNRILITYHSLFLFPSCKPPECGAPLRCRHQCSFRPQKGCAKGWKVMLTLAKCPSPAASQSCHCTYRNSVVRLILTGLTLQ